MTCLIYLRRMILAASALERSMTRCIDRWIVAHMTLVYDPCTAQIGVGLDLKPGQLSVDWSASTLHSGSSKRGDAVAESDCNTRKLHNNNANLQQELHASSEVT
jgi:hypothetical protein